MSGITSRDKVLLESYYRNRELEQQNTRLRKCIVRIHEIIETAADVGTIPMFMLEEITKVISRAEDDKWKYEE